VSILAKSTFFPYTDFMNRLPLFLVIAVCWTPPVHAQHDSLAPPSFVYGIIDTIFVTGNEKTKAYVILDEMTLKSGSLATLGAIEFDRNRIYSLGLFTRVDILYDTLNGTRFLDVDVSERWYLIPLPIFGFRDGDAKKAFYGGGVLHNNFRGRNQKLFGSVVFGYDPALSLSFFDPLLDRENRLYFSANASYSRVKNKSSLASLLSGDFDERHYDINVTLGRRPSLYQTVGFNVGYQIVEVPNYMPGRTISTDGTDRFIYGSLNYTYDSRDLREYASTGQLVYAYATKLGFGESDVNFARFGVDIRRYVLLPMDLTFAARVQGTIVSGGPVPTYAHVFFGYGERIRGYFKTVFEGENLVGTTVELHYPLLKPRTINFSAVPLPPEFSVWRFGINLALFADAGVTWFRGEKIQLDSFASGYGMGVHFLLPYSIILRTEYAWNEYFKGQFIVDFRASI
jgi:outer membrane protein assembly factor BamA